MRWMLLFVIFPALANAQKKPLDHSVYDGWQSFGERHISNDGKWVAYTINPQEGDGVLVVQATDNSYKKEIPRGYSAVISEDSRFVICKIRPFFKDTREAKIKKKKPDDMPKDSLAIIEPAKDNIVKIARVRSFKAPEKGEGQWVAYLSEKSLPATDGAKAHPDSLAQLDHLLHMADSLTRVADSLRNIATEAKTKGMEVLKTPVKDKKPAAKPADPVEEGTELTLRNLSTGAQQTFKLVNDYYFNEKGNALLIQTTRKNNDTLSKASLVWMDLSSGKTTTIMQGFNEIKNPVFDKEGTQLAFAAERDSAAKALQKFYKLWYYKVGMDSVQLKVDRNTSGVAKGLTVSENYLVNFSKDGKKLFFGLARIQRPEDTTLVDFETARLDVWHYNDDYLQPQQLVQLNIDLRKSYLAVLDPQAGKIVQLGADDAENTFLVDEGNADYVLATSTKGNRIEAQWTGNAKQTAYIISTADGSRKAIKQNLNNFFNVSPKGKYVIWYDPKDRNYYTYNVSTGAINNITKDIKVPLYDEDDDHPDDPPQHGTMAWHEGDKYVYIYDKYDIWKCDPDGKTKSENITLGRGRNEKVTYRYIQLSRDDRYLADTQSIILRTFNNTDKRTGWSRGRLNHSGFLDCGGVAEHSLGFSFLKAKNADKYLYSYERFDVSPQLIAGEITPDRFPHEVVLASTNPQQKNYNWLTAELVKWKMFDGKEAEGVLYKPENFDPKKKYPIIFYFYEKDADNLYNYRAPAPSASTINIPWFVSNGYLVFDPNIYYKNGQPGESAYNSVVSAAKFFAKKPWVDSTKMALQGQSWGGYQVAYLVTRTNIFACAGAGAPVANMTSAYGGIRWGTGLNRQFQYERTQSRIGASLWQRPDLYIKNSPLFHADKVTTPLLITHNDADGSVPWTQGIEYFTALRRLGKKVWMLEYNGEDHNLVERRNRKDLSIRLGQFFDHFLKGAPEAKWIAEGVPATLKGIDWGFETEEKKGF